jgi:hypothetical protein
VRLHHPTEFPPKAVCVGTLASPAPPVVASSAWPSLRGGWYGAPLVNTTVMSLSSTLRSESTVSSVPAGGYDLSKLGAGRMVIGLWARTIEQPGPDRLALELKLGHGLGHQGLPVAVDHQDRALTRARSHTNHRRVQPRKGIFMAL